MKQKWILRVVLASPGDVQAERDTLPRVIDGLNRSIGAERGLLLELHRWETDAYPGFHAEGPQGLIDSVLEIEECDILIGIFWKRFGTPTKYAQSGTEHEILRAREAWKETGKPQIMVYFNQSEHEESSEEEAEQYNRVLDFKRRFPAEGLWWDYKGRDEFERLVRDHLAQFILRQYPIGAERASSRRVERVRAKPTSLKGGEHVSGLVSSLKKYGSRLVLRREALRYLDDVAKQAAELPAYFPEHLHTSETGKTRFDEIRQMVQVIEDRAAFEQWLVKEQERLRAAGQGFEQVAYKPTRARLEGEEHDEARGDGPAGPTPVVWDERAGERFKRAIILGDPGFGKTWLLRYEARRLASDAARLLREQRISLSKINLPIFANLAELNQSDDPLEDSLVDLACKGYSDSFRHFMRKKLQSEQCVILMDAWDEVPVERPKAGRPIEYRPRRRQRLGERLKIFARQFPQPRLLLTSRIVGYDPTHLPIPGMQELELLAFNSPQTEAFILAWFGDDTRAAKQCLAMLRRSPQLRGLGRIPLMLTLLCRTYIECQEKGCDFPAHRVELYDRCLRGLLRDWKGEKEQQEISNAYVEAALELLDAVSYTLFAEGYEQFSESDLRKQIIKWHVGLKYKHEFSREDPTSIIDKLKRDGLLISAGKHRNAPLLFLHRTFHEYLTARALGRILEDEQTGAQAEIELRGKKITAKQLLDKKGWDSRWQEVIILLSGLLKEPAPLLKMVADKERDDIFRSRLALAALCLPEVNAARRAQIAALADEITTAAFSLWWQHQMMETARAVPALSRALPALAQVNARVDGTPLLEWISQRMSSKKAEERAAAAAALGEMGSAAAKPEVLDVLAQLLGRNLDDAVAAIEKLGGAAAVPTILCKLVELFVGRLQDPEMDEWSYSVARYQIAEPLVHFMLDEDSSAAATPIILGRLEEMLQGLSSSPATTLMLAVCDIVGLEPSRVMQDHWDREEEVSAIEMLARLLQDLKPGGRYAAKKEAEGGDASQTASIDFDYVNRVTPDNLAPLLQNEHWFFRSRALRAVCKNHRVARTPAILDQLVRILQDPDSGTAVTPFVFDRLDYILVDLNWGTSNWGDLAVVKRTSNDLIPILKAWSVAVMALSTSDSDAAAPLCDLDRLARMLRGPEDEVRRIIHLQLSQLSKYTVLLERSVATLAICLIGGAAATPPILDRLAHILKESDDYSVWSAAVIAVRYIGRAAEANTSILDQIARMLAETDWLEQFAAVIMIGGIGSAAATEPILESLALMLQRPNWLERSAALFALQAIGGAAVTKPAISNQLAQLLEDQAPEVRYETVLAIGQIGGAAVTSTVPDLLTRLLEHPVPEMRAAAAFTLGRMTQSGTYLFAAKDGIELKRAAELSAV